MSLVTGEPRSATVVANVPTDVLELDRGSFAALLGRYPILLANLTRILGRRLARRNAGRAEGRRRAEAIGLVVDRSSARLAADLFAATRSAGPHRVTAMDLTGSLSAHGEAQRVPSVEAVLASLDDRLADRGPVLIVAGTDRGDELSLLLEHMDRVLALTTEPGVEALAPWCEPVAERTELALICTDPGRSAPPRTLRGLRVVRSIRPERSGRDVAWLGRHLARTKLGLALGAGGAKGYAHVGVLRVLEEAGYTVDYVAGSSIGAMVGSWLALGRDAAEIEAIMRRAFAPENVSAMFKIALSGMSTGLEVHTGVCRETTRERTFEDLEIPLSVMAVDLNSRQPAPIREGPLWEALLASTAVAGLFPPLVRGGQRLVDGVALVPVPTGAVIGDGADITLSVNLMSRETLSEWPGEPSPTPPPARSGSRMLDTLLEVIDLAQIDASVRNAALADVVVTPQFGPGSWRDFHLADLFLDAGRRAAEAGLPALRSLARPQEST